MFTAASRPAASSPASEPRGVVPTRIAVLQPLWHESVLSNFTGKRFASGLDELGHVCGIDRHVKTARNCAVRPHWPPCRRTDRTTGISETVRLLYHVRGLVASCSNFLVLAMRLLEVLRALWGFCHQSVTVSLFPRPRLSFSWLETLGLRSDDSPRDVSSKDPCLASFSERCGGE